MPTTMAEREEITRGGSGGTEKRESGSGFADRIREFFARLASYPGRFRQFVHEARVELKHVNWPSRDDVKSTTVVVIVTIFIFGLFLFGVDRVAAFVVDYLLTRFR